MASPWYGDVLLMDKDKRMVSYVLTRERDFKHDRCPKLYDNSKEIKIRKYEPKTSFGRAE